MASAGGTIKRLKFKIPASIRLWREITDSIRHALKALRSDFGRIDQADERAAAAMQAARA
jgi:hypothetical protein